ncbi:uncharacterized protein [Montipora foliosa]|uniref:uncharacterized protein n=1 Tax=Montipora foliosa TaxID=591990 RepID=UPI0035F1CFB6
MSVPAEARMSVECNGKAAAAKWQLGSENKSQICDFSRYFNRKGKMCSRKCNCIAHNFKPCHFILLTKVCISMMQNQPMDRSYKNNIYKKTNPACGIRLTCPDHDLI